MYHFINFVYLINNLAIEGYCKECVFSCEYERAILFRGSYRARGLLRIVLATDYPIGGTIYIGWGNINKQNDSIC